MLQISGKYSCSSLACRYNNNVARQDILDNLNISEEDFNSWKGFQETCEYLVSLNQQGIVPRPFILSIRPDTSIIHFLSSLLFAGGKDYPDLNHIPDKILSSEDFLNVFDYLSNLMRICKLKIENVDIHPYELNNNYYYNNSSVFYIGNWNTVVNNTLNKSVLGTNPESQFRPYKIPSFNSNNSTYGGGSVLAVSSKSKYKEEARKLIDLMVSEQFSEEWLEQTCGVPAFDTDFWHRRYTDKNVNVLYELTKHSKSYPLHPIWSSTEDRLSVGISNALWNIIESIEKPEKYNLPSILKKYDIEITNLLKMNWR